MLGTLQRASSWPLEDGQGLMRTHNLNTGRGVGGEEDALADIVLPRENSLMDVAGSKLKAAGSNLQPQRANTLPTDDGELRYAATMPMTFDLDSARPCCCGLWKLQQFAGFVLGVGALLTLLVAQPMQAHPHANSMLGLTAMCACFWIFEAMPGGLGELGVLTRSIP